MIFKNRFLNVLRWKMKKWWQNLEVNWIDMLGYRVLEAPQARHVSNRRWSEPRERNRRKRTHPAPALQGLNVQPLQGWRYVDAYPPVPRSLCSRSTDGYSRCAPAGLLFIGSSHFF